MNTVDKEIALFKNQEGMNNKDIIFFFLSDFVEDIAEEWGEYLDFTHAYGTLNNAEKPLFVIHSNKIKAGVLCESGAIYEVKINTRKTGGVTWNGDDEYFNEFEILFSVKSFFATIESMKKLQTASAAYLENIAAEIVSTVCQ